MSDYDGPASGWAMFDGETGKMRLGGQHHRFWQILLYSCLSNQVKSLIAHVDAAPVDETVAYFSAVSAASSAEARHARRPAK